MAEQAKGRRPVIGVTQGNLRQTGWWLICLAVYLAGGKPCLISPAFPCTGNWDGLILGGGTDVHPDRYGGMPKENYQYDLARDELEIGCLARAEKNGLPVLGICRGAQLLNVAHGGTLCIDISKAYEKANYPSGLLARFFYRKPIWVQAGSKIAELLGCKTCHVNSMHTQSVLTLGHALEITAAEDNGIVQTIEDGSRPFSIGVQFHPEYLIYRARFRRIFEALISQAVAVIGK